MEPRAANIALHECEGESVLYDLSQHALAIDSQSPCGRDCEYDGEFLALSQAVVGKAEQQFGASVIPAVDPDWRVVEQMATQLLGRTKDLRVAAWLTQAATRLHGVAGFAAGVQLINLLCQQYWDDVHPRLVIDGDNDPYLRISALTSLSDSGSTYADGSPIMRALRDALIANRAMPIKIRDVEMTAANDAGARYTDTQIVAALKDEIALGSEAIVAFEQAAQAIGALDAQVKSQMSGDEQPDFSALKNLIKSVHNAIARAQALSAGDLSDSDGDAQAAGADTTSPGALVGGASGSEIRSREDVRRALQRVCAYLEKQEPSSPASLFARRAERMLGMDFIGIMRELSPESIQQIQMVTGAKGTDE